MNLIYSEAKRQLLGLLTLSDPGTVEFEKDLRDSARLALAEMLPTTLQAVDVTMEVFPDYVTATDGVYLEATADSRVLRFVDVNGASTGLAWTPPVNGTWDRLMSIALVHTAGSTTTEFRVQAWEFFSKTTGVAEGDPPNTVRYYVSIDRPWRNSTDADMTFRIYQQNFWTPNWTNGLIGRVCGRIYNASQQEILLVSQDQLQPTKREMGTGMPTLVARSGQYALQPLRRAVVAESITPSSWTGPEQEGQWQFYATVVGGRMSRAYNIGGTEIVDPTFESAPTPVSVEFDHADHSGLKIRLSAPNPDQMLNFDTSGALREGRTGLRVRFYAACNGLIAAGAGDRNDVSADGVPYLLAEVDPIPGTMDVRYTWGGESLDRTRVMFASGEQFSHSIYPRPNLAYTIDFKCLKRMAAFWGDEDPLPIKPEALNAFLYLWAAQVGPKRGIGLNQAEEWRAFGRVHMSKALATDAEHAPVRTGMWNGSSRISLRDVPFRFRRS